MHWVDRGPEPSGLEEIRVRYTPPWERTDRLTLASRSTPWSSLARVWLIERGYLV